MMECKHCQMWYEKFNPVKGDALINFCIYKNCAKHPQTKACKDFKQKLC